MIINTQALQAIRPGFNASFKRGLGQATSQYTAIATVVNSTTKDNTYGWLGKMPNMREWIGERVVNGIAEHDYTIKNKDYELTVGVARNDILDENLGVYDPMFVEMGESTTKHPDIMCFGTLAKGFTSPCYDGQFFFDTDHPVINADGSMSTVSNFGGGAGRPWFLMSTNSALKPIIYQERQKPNFVALDNPMDANVFFNKEFLYSVEGRNNTGYGFWQMAYASRQPLTGANFAAAYSAMEGMTGDHGRPLVR